MKNASTLQRSAHEATVQTLLLALTFCGANSLADPLSSAWISYVAQKKSGALSRPTLFPLPQDQVLAMAAPAPAATVTASATVKASTTMGAFAAMKAFATIVPSTPVAHAAVRAAVAGMVRPVIGAVIEVVVVVSFM